MALKEGDLYLNLSNGQRWFLFFLKILIVIGTVCLLAPGLSESRAEYHRILNYSDPVAEQWNRKIKDVIHYGYGRFEMNPSTDTPGVIDFHFNRGEECRILTARLYDQLLFNKSRERKPDLKRDMNPFEVLAVRIWDFLD